MDDLEAGRREEDQPVDAVEQRTIGAGERGVDMAPPDAVRIAFGLQRIDGVAEVVRRLRRRADAPALEQDDVERRSEEHTSELQSLMRISYAVFCLKKKKKKKN